MAASSGESCARGAGTGDSTSVKPAVTATAATDRARISGLSSRRWRRQNGEHLLRLRFLLDFHFADEQRRRRSGNRNAPAFRATDPVEDIHLVARRDDLAERRQRRADQIDAAHELGRARLVGVHLIY